jgi:uncharacterized protein YpbB
MAGAGEIHPAWRVGLMTPDAHNPEFQLAVRFVNQTARALFLTGKAGTGKTTFLKYIRENSFKKMAVVAPTGVAAINAGGTTLHSFFQLPFGPFIPTPQYGWNVGATGFSDPNSLFKNIRFNVNKRELLQELELLVIDEISMVRADMLDAVDTILRHFRQQPLLPFGGLQVLYIGDLFQLPPVVSKEEWELLQSHYQSPFFFDAQVIRQDPPVYLELKKIYRQKEARFIHILNNIRNNRTTPEDLELLHNYYQPEFQAPKTENYITLTSHNAVADRINQEELNKLRGKAYAFEATVTGEFSDKAFPAEKTLTLKEGTQIMLIKNDKGETRRYYNGKIGIIQKIAGDKITIAFPDEPDELILEKETWRNIRYQYDAGRDRIEEEELGTFSQYPIRLAWAITIHKSQGLTFERAVIDAGASFAPGQVYVALSRLTNIEGLVLRSRILPYSISTDVRVVAYTQRREAETGDEGRLEQEQIAFISDSLPKAFRWSRLVEQMQFNYQEYTQRQIPDKLKAIEWGKRCLDCVLTQQETAQKFTRQLEQLLPAAEADGYRQLHQRMAAAAGYFVKSLDEDLLGPLQEHIAEMRIKTKAKKYVQTLQTLKAIILRKKQQIEDALQQISGLQQGVNPTHLLDQTASNHAAGSTVSDHAAGSSASRHTAIPAASGSPASGSPASDSPASGKPKKGDSHRISLHLYKEGVAVREIAARRGLNETTVESHLASFIPTGEIDIKELVPEHKIDRIAAVIAAVGGSALGPIKSKLGEDVSFGEIRAVMSHLRRAEKTTG